ISAWRRAAFGDFTSAFRFSQPQPQPPLLPDDTAEQLEKAKEEVATLPKPTLPGADQSFPRQEKGQRPHV
ncbi:phospholipase, partial [Streptomyces mirabilis]